MELSQKILADITKVTNDIQQHYPELEEYLDENPLTLHDGDSKDVELNNDVLRDYLESLEQLILKYNKKDKIKKAIR